MNKSLLILLAFMVVGCLSSHLPAISTEDVAPDVRVKLAHDIQPECWEKSDSDPYQLSSALYECKRDAQYFNLVDESNLASVLSHFRQCMANRGWTFRQVCSKNRE
jgi:hypothetical protein